jgi:hypothetical protein
MLRASLPPSLPPAASRPVVAVDSRRQDLRALAEQHANKLSVSNAYKLSAQNDKFQLENGGFFDSKLYSVKYDDPSRQGSVLAARGGEEGGGGGLRPTSDLVDSLACAVGLQQQEQRVRELGQQGSPAWRKEKEALEDLLPVSRYEQARTEHAPPSGLQYKGAENVTAKDFLDNWLASDEKLDAVLGKKLSPQRGSSGEQRAESTASATSRSSLRQEAGIHSSSSGNQSANNLSMDAKIRAPPQAVSSARREEESDGHDANVLRSQSAEKRKKGSRNSPYRNINKSSSRSTSRGRDNRGGGPVEGEGERDPREYVYQQRFDPSRPRQQRGGQADTQPPRSPGRQHQPHFQSQPAHDQHNPYQPQPQQQQQQQQQPQQQPQQPFAPPHGYQQAGLFAPQNNPYDPYQHPPYPHPYQHPSYAHPYQQQYPSFNPFQQQQQQFQQPAPYPPPNQFQQQQQQPPPFQHMQPPSNSLNPPPVEDPFLGEMDKLQKMIEQENEKLLSNPALKDVSKVLSPPVNMNTDEQQASGAPGPAAVASNNDPPRRRNRSELKHHYEMEAIKHDMEKLRQVSALEELKEQLETDKQAKRAEGDHQRWLDDQKRVMQSLKIKQAVLAEEENFKRTENAIHPKAPAATPPSAVKEKSPPDETASEKVKKSASKSSLKRADSVVPLKYVDRLFVSVDGVTVMPGAMFGDQFRVSVSLFENRSRKIVGRAYQSEWDSWVRPAGGGGGAPGATSFLKNAITKTPPSKLYSKRNAAKCDAVSETELSKDGGNFLKVVVEVQARELKGPHQSAGWVVFDLPLVSPLGGLPTTDPKAVKVSVGAWRMRGRRGIKDAFGPQMSTKADGLDMWLLFRINAPAEGQIDSLKGDYLNSETILSRHEPLDGDFGIHPSESKNNNFRKMKKVVSALSAIRSFKSLSDKSDKVQQASEKSPSALSSARPSRSSSTSSTAKSLRSASTKKSLKSEVSKVKGIVNAMEAFQSHDSDDDGESRGGSYRSGSSRSSGSRSSRSRSSGSRSSGSRSSRSSRSRSSRSRSSSSGRSDGEDSLDDKIPEDSSDDPMSKFWTLGTSARPCDCKYQKGDGIDIYIDGAMFLPDNCTVTRVVVKLMTSDYEVVGEVHEATSLASEGSNISPVYKFKIECRKEVFNVTLTALIRIDTMDSVSLETVGVGYAAIKVFSTLNREQPTVSKQPNTFINTGLFQLPLYGGRLKKSSDMSEKYLSEVGLPLLPCASLLVRIYAAPKAPDGLLVLSRADFPRDDWVRKRVDIPASAYLSGDYDGSQCEPTFPLELTAFEAKAALPTKTVENACSEAVAAKPRSSLRGHVQPPADGASPAEVTQWLGSLLLAPNATRGVLDYSLAVPYSFVGGMSLTVERLIKMPTPGLFGSNDVLFKVIYSTSPPGLLYKDPPLAEGAHFTANIKSTSEVYAPEFEDGPVIFNPTNMEQSLCVIFDVRLLNMEFDKASASYKLKIDSNPDTRKSKDKKYWTLFPVGAETVLRGGFSHLVSGVFQLPLFEGPVPAAIALSPDPMREVLDALGAKKPPPSLSPSLSLCDSGASVLFKCVNPCLGGVLAAEQDRWTEHVSTRHLDAILAAARAGRGSSSAVKPDTFTFIPGEYMGSGVKTIPKQLSKGGGEVKKMLKEVNKEFAAAYNLRFDD